MIAEDVSLLAFVALFSKDTQSALASDREKGRGSCGAVSGEQNAPQKTWPTSLSQNHITPPPPSGKGCARAKGDEKEGWVSPTTVSSYLAGGKLWICVY